MRISELGVTVEVPDGWDGRVRSRAHTDLPLGGPLSPEALSYRRERLVTAHAANFSLPGADGSFGTSATSAMPRRGIFLSLVEYQAGSGLEPGVGLYEPLGLPTLTVSELRADSLLRALPGQAGAQRFFTAANRPFCLYVVVGDGTAGAALVPTINRLIAAIEIS